MWLLAGCAGGDPTFFPVDTPCSERGAPVAAVLAAHAAYAPGDSSRETRITLVRSGEGATLVVTHLGEPDDAVDATQVRYDLAFDGRELVVVGCRRAVSCARSLFPPCA